MTVETVIIIFVMLFKSVMWGHGENRHWYDRGPALQPVGNHFTSYHLFMLLFFGLLNTGFSCALTSVWYIQVALTVWLTVWDVLILDVTWWVERYLDLAVFKIPRNYYDEGKGQPWHSISDWDAGGFPLWHGTYSWWFVFAGVLTVLGVSIFLLVQLK